MGTTPSVNLNTELNLSYFSLKFAHTDRLRLILAPESVAEVTENVLSINWKIKKIRKSSGFVEFKLTGQPWCCIGTGDLAVKYFICTLIKEYYARGWHIKASSDIHRTGADTSALFFEKREPLSTYVICISMNDTDKLRILGPDNLIPLLKQAIVKSWPYGIQRERPYERSIEFKLKGNPWSGWSSGDGEESHYTPVLMNEILLCLYTNGWVFSSAIDTRKSQQGMNALYFKYCPELKNSDSASSASFFPMSLNRNDRIRLMKAPNDLVQAVKNTIPQLWFKGIQEEIPAHFSYEFKLKGNPWNSTGKEAVDSRRLINGLFGILRRIGWEMYALCDLSKNLSNKSTFFFRYNPSNKPLRNVCLSLNETDKIRVIDGDQSIVDQVRTSIATGWPYGIQMETIYNNSYEFKLCRFPFQSVGGDQVYSCVMLMTILHNMLNMGFNLIASADVSSKYASSNDNTYTVDLHSWFFEQKTPN